MYAGDARFIHPSFIRPGAVGNTVYEKGDNPMDTKSIRKEFVSPSVAYRGKPFWSWNGELCGEEAVRQAHVMKEMGLGGYFMHSRAGLITEYLGDEWFDIINEVADAAEKDGMEAWLYDEDRWPSGSAGGKVTVDPQYRMKSLVVYEMLPEKYAPADDTYALYVAKMSGINMWAYKELTDFSTDAVADAIGSLTDQYADEAGTWKVLRFAIVPDKPNSNYNGTTYIDTMSRKAVDKFIDMTHEEYARRCGDRIGTTIKGIFTDEPHRGHCLDNRREEDGVMSCYMCWTDDLFDEFLKRYGYDARPIIPELFFRFKGEKVSPIKLNYIDLADNLFIERFADPINNWCNDHNMIFTGHVLHEDSLMNQTVPNGSLMRFYEHMGYPGIDCLTEWNGCYWIVKQLTSAARQIGKKWLLSELYGCTGWQFNFKSHKTVGDWQALFGINLRCQHLSWYTMEGESKRDYPASILHQSPWYKDYRKVEDYFARFGLVMSEGKPDCDVLVLNPIESLWCQAYAGWASWISNVSPDVGPIEKRYQELFHFLTDRQIDFDYGEEEMMSRMGSVGFKNGRPVLRVGNAEYRTVVVSDMLTIRPSTIALLRAFMVMGGKVIFAGDVPAYVDAVKSDVPATLAQAANAVVVPFDGDKLAAAIRENAAAYVSITKADGTPATDVFAQVRRDFGGDGYACVVLNTDRNQPRTGLSLSIRVPAGYALEEWDMETGLRYDASALCTYRDGCAVVALDLEAAGTRCFVLTRTAEALPAVHAYTTEKTVTVKGEFAFDRDERNVCVLDWCKWRWAGKEWSGLEEALKADQHVRDSLGLEHRGGGMLQPWYAKLNDTRKYGELQLEYEFNIDKLPEGDVFLAGERPEFNHYKLNGVALSNPDVNEFWVDDCFKKMPIPAGVLKVGRNVVTIDVTFMRTTNIEALYLVGEFGVRIDGQTRTLVDLPTVIGCENYETYDLPFYTGCMTFHMTPDQYKGLLGDAGMTADRIVLTPDAFTGGCVKVTALGKTTVLGWDPYEADVTEAVRAGAPIDVTVVGTRRNVFGPLHEIPRLNGAYGPGNFVTGGKHWTDDYSLLDSGLRGIILKAQKAD